MDNQIPMEKVLKGYQAHVADVTEKLILTEAALGVALETIDALNAELDEVHRDNK